MSVYDIFGLQKQFKTGKVGSSLKIEEYLINFGKCTSPFTHDSQNKPLKCSTDIEIMPKSTSFELKTIPYLVLANKMLAFRKEGKIEEALNCGLMKLQCSRWVTGKADVDAMANIAEMALDNQQYEVAAKYAKEGLISILPMHS